MTARNELGPSDELATRYGRPSVAHRNLGVVLIGLVVAVLLLWVVWATLGRSEDRVSGLVESFVVRSPHEVAVTVQITRSGTGPAHCTIEAIATDHSSVGQRVVRLPAGPGGTHRISTVIRTEREATAADVVDCG